MLLVLPICAVFRQGAGVVAFGKAFAVVVQDQTVVVIGGGRQAQEVLKCDLQRRGLQEIGAAVTSVMPWKASSTTTARW